MASTNKRQSDLAALIGSKSHASEIMNRKRPLMLRIIQKIIHNWKISATSLIAPYHLDSND